MIKISIAAKNFLFLFLCFALLLPLSYTSSMQSSNYIIERDSINFSGTDESESSSYRLSDTMGEVGTGELQDRCFSMSFDGSSQYIDVGTLGNFGSQKGSGFTISAWVYSTDDANIRTIMGVSDGSSGENSISLKINAKADNSLLAGSVRTSIGDNVGSKWLTGGTNANNITTNAWHYLVATAFPSTNTLNFYIDGSLESTVYYDQWTPSSFSNFVNSLFIGAYHRPGETLTYFKGNIDDVRLYNRVLSQSEVTDLYNGKHISNSNLVGYWNFDEGSGTVVNDMSGNNNTGTIYGNAEYSTSYPSQTCNILNAGYRQTDAAAAGYTISINSPADVTLSPAFGGISGGTGNGSAIWKVTTDNPSGYQLDIRAGTSPALKSGSYSFADYIPFGPDPDYDWSVASSDSEFGYSVEGAHTVGKFLDNGSACSTGSGNISDKCWLGFSTSNATIAAGASSNDPSGTETTVKFRAEAGSQRMQESGEYAAAIVVTAIQL